MNILYIRVITSSVSPIIRRENCIYIVYIFLYYYDVNLGKTRLRVFPIDFFHSQLSFTPSYIFDIILHIIDIILYTDRYCERQRAARVSRPQIVIKHLLYSG